MNHKQKMIKIGAMLTHDNVMEIKYIFADKIGDGVLETIKNGSDMIKALERIGTIDEDNYKELVDLLENLGRKDLISIIYPQSQPANWSNINNKLNSITNPTSKDAIYNDALTPNIMDKVAIQLGAEWLRFGRHLNLKEAELDLIENDNKKAYDKAFQLLKLWKQKSKEGCLTWSKLKNELMLFNRYDIIREIETDFKHLKDIGNQ
ncbi:uncharacterized protein LOC136090524 [Hydra vulgaris]|uniref:Uncharacterized protein LOC136090524 n=1 Tax=Hydra vulgaris TaxID=6087 RepID=A0ABM4DFY8_HYDVU